MCKYIREWTYGEAVNTINCMLKASKAQMHIFIQLFSQLSVTYMKSDLTFSFLFYQPTFLYVLYMLETQ